MQGRQKRLERGNVKYMRTLGSLLLNTSILFKKRMTDVRKNHRELMTDSKRTRDSAIRFCDTSVGEKGDQKSGYAPVSSPRGGPDHILTTLYRR